MKKLTVFGLVVLAGCAHPYTLDPLGGKSVRLNGITLSTITTPKCVLQAGYQYSNPNEMLVKVRITNEEKAPFDIDPATFRMTGPMETLKTSPLNASDPDLYVKDLTAKAELLDSRTKMESYQGVEELGELKGNTADRQIDAAKDDYLKKQNEAETARKQAKAIRERVAIIQPLALHKATVKSGSTIEGALIFKAEFGETGVVTLESIAPACVAKLQFMLKK